MWFYFIAFRFLGQCGFTWLTSSESVVVFFFLSTFVCVCECGLLEVIHEGLIKNILFIYVSGTSSAGCLKTVVLKRHEMCY